MKVKQHCAGSGIRWVTIIHISGGLAMVIFSHGTGSKGWVGVWLAGRLALGWVSWGGWLGGDDRKVKSPCRGVVKPRIQRAERSHDHHDHAHVCMFLLYELQNLEYESRLLRTLCRRIENNECSQ